MPAAISSGLQVTSTSNVLHACCGAEAVALQTLSISPVHADNHPGPAQPGTIRVTESKYVRLKTQTRCKIIQTGRSTKLKLQHEARAARPRTVDGLQIPDDEAARTESGVSELTIA